MSRETTDSKKKCRCPGPCTVEEVVLPDGVAAVRICIPLTEDPLVPPLEKEPPINPPLGGRNVLLHNGAYMDVAMDLRVASRGFDFQFVRTHRTDIEYDCILGQKWDHAYNKRIVPAPGTVFCTPPVFCEYYTGDGPTGGGPIDYLNGDGTRETHAFVRWTRRTVKFCGGTFKAIVSEYQQLPGERFLFTRYAVLEGDNPYTTDQIFYMMRFFDGTRYIFNCHGYVVLILDKNQNRMSFSYGLPINPLTKYLVLRTVRDTAQRSYQLDYQEIQGVPRLRTLTDFTGRTVTCDYNNNVELITVTGPSGDAMRRSQVPAGAAVPKQPNVRKYAYDGSSRLTGVFAPREVANGGDSVIQNTFQGGRIVSQRWGGTTTGAPKAGGEFQFRYSGGVLDTVVDRRGTEMKVLFETIQGRKVIRETRVKNRPIPYRNLTVGNPPAAFVKKFEHNQDYQLTKVTHPGGLEETFGYDPNDVAVTMGDEREWVEANVTWLNNQARGNILQRTLKSPRAADITREEFWTWDPLFNVPLTITEIGGARRSMRYDHGWCATPENNGNPLDVKWPDRSLPDGSLTPMDEAYTYTTGGLVEQRIDSFGTVHFATYTAEGYLETNTQDENDLQLKSSFKYDARGNVIRVTNPRGFAADQQFDDRDRLVWSQGPLSNLEERSYDENDCLTAVVYHVKPTLQPPQVSAMPAATREEEIRYRHDILNQTFERILDPAGKGLKATYEYNENGSVVKEVTPRGNAGTPRDATGRIYDVRELMALEIRCPFGTSTVSTSNPAEAVHQIVYNAAGHAIHEVDAERHVTSMTPDGFGFVQQIKDSAGGITRREPDPVGRLFRVSQLGQTGGATPATGSGQGNKLLSRVEFEYDEYGNVIARNEESFRRLNPRRQVRVLRTEFWRNALHQVVAEVRPDGSECSVIHDGLGRSIFHVDAAGGTVELKRDENGNVRETIVTNNPDTGSTLPVQPARTVTTTDTYDELDRMTASDNGLGSVALYGYDTLGRNISSQSPRGYVTTYEYDKAGRQTGIYRYGAAGNYTTGVVHTRQEFDANGNVTSAYDGEGHMTGYEFDCFDRLIALIDADGKLAQYEYDRNSRMRKLTKRNGQTLKHDYDVLNRLSSRYLDPNPGLNYSTSQSFQYDGAGCITQAIDATGISSVTTVNEYDSLNRLVAEGWNGRSTNYFYEFETFPRRILYPEGKLVEWQPDAAGRQKVISVEGRELASYLYDSLTRLSERTVHIRLTDTGPTGAVRVTDFPLVRQYRYDGLNRWQSSWERTTSSASGKYNVFVPAGTLSYDPDGFVASYDGSDGHIVYEYDGLGRVVHEVANKLPRDTDIILRSSRMQYDDANNLRFVKSYEDRYFTPNRQTTSHMWVNPLNQLIRKSSATWVGGQLAKGNPQFSDYTYNDQAHLKESQIDVPQLPGEPRVRGVRRLEYDVFDRLYRAEFEPSAKGTQGSVLAFRYDALGRRVETDYFTTIPGRQIDFQAAVEHYYAGERVVEERRRPAGRKQARLARRYYWGPNAADLVAFDVNPRETVSPADFLQGGKLDWTTFFYHSDYRNSLVALSRRDLVAQAGAAGSSAPIHEQYEYAEPGVQVYKWDYTQSPPKLAGEMESDTDQKFFFQGSQYERQVYLQTFGNRALDPDLGRFTTRDPIGAWADPMALGNGYVFAGNNPVNFTDRGGRSAAIVWDAAAVAMDVDAIERWDDDTPWYDMALDSFALALDTTLAILPTLPAGAGAALRLYRASKYISFYEKLRSIDRIVDLNRVLHFGKAVEQGVNVIRGIETGLRTLRSWDGYLETGNPLHFVFGVLGTFATYSHFRDAINGVCFPAGTSVLTPNGAKGIEELTAGEEVVAVDEEGNVSWRTVGTVRRTKTTHLRDLTLESSAKDQPVLLSTTDGHPFWNARAGKWVRAADLVAGDEIALLKGSAVVRENQRRQLERTTFVYNLEVSDDHTYFAGSLLALVHNGCWHEQVFGAKLDDARLTTVNDTLVGAAEQGMLLIRRPRTLRQLAQKLPWVRILHKEIVPEKFNSVAGKEAWGRIAFGNALQQVVDLKVEFDTLRSLLNTPIRQNKVLGINSITDRIMRPDWWIETMEIVTFDLSTVREFARGHTSHYFRGSGGLARAGFGIIYEMP